MKDYLHQHRWRLFSIAALAAFAALVITLLPIGMRIGLVAWLESDGQRKAAVENVDFNPFTGELLIEGFRVSAPSGRGIRVSRLRTDLEISSIVKRRLHFRSIEIEGGDIDIEMDQSGGLRLPGLPAKSASKSRSGGPVDWLFGIDGFRIARLALRIHKPDGLATIRVEKFGIGSIGQWQAALPARFDTTIEFDRALLTITGSTRPFSPSPSIDARITAKNLDLARLRPFLRVSQLADLSGRTSADLQSRIVFQGRNRTEVLLKGGLQLAVPKAAFEVKEAAPETAESATVQRYGAAQARFENLDVRFEFDRGVASKLRVNVESRIDDLTVLAGDIALSQGMASWNGGLVLTNSQSAGSTLNLRGNLELSRSQMKTTRIDEPKGDRVSADSIKIDDLTSTLTRSSSGRYSAEFQGQIALTGIHTQTGETAIANEAVSWRGRLSMTEDSEEGTTISGSGKFDSRGLQIQLPDPRLDLTQAESAWEGDFAFRPGRWPNAGDLVMKAKARGSRIRADAPELGMTLINLGDLSVDGIELTGSGDVRVARLTGRELYAMQPLAKGGANANETKAASARRVISLGVITANGVTMTERAHVAAKKVAVEGFDIALVRRENGEFLLVNSVLNLLGAQSAEPDSREGAGLTFTVGNWSVGGNSRLTFTDASVKPNAKISVAPIELRLKDIDSRNPNLPSPIDLNAKLGRYGKINLKGTIRPLQPRLSLELKGKVAGLEMSTFRGYSNKYLGYDLTRGRLNADVQGRIVDGKLGADSSLVISKLKISASDPKLVKPMTDRLQIPLESALALLRDSDDVIRLKVPITGDLSNPKFDFSDAINTALGNAMKETVMATVKLAFPLGGVIMSIAQAAGKSTLRFAPVPFDAGEAVLGEGAQSQLGKLAALLKARPGVKITICGAVTEGDRQTLLNRARAKQEPAQAEGKAPAKTTQSDSAVKKAVAAQLAPLSRRRSETVKDTLIKQHKIAGERLFLCAPKIETDKDKDASPRADIFL